MSIDNDDDILDILVNRSNFFDINKSDLSLIAEDFYLLIIDEDHNIIKANRKFIDDFKNSSDHDQKWSADIKHRSYAPTYFFAKNKDTDKQNLQKNDGRYIWVQWHNYPTEIGGQKYTVKFGFDITESEQAAQIILKINDHAKIGFWRVDLIEQSLYWSDEIYDIHGVKKSEYTPTVETAINFYHEDDIPIITERVEKCIETGEPFSVQLRIITSSSHTSYVESIGKPEFDNDNNIIAISGTFKDRTQTVLIEESHEQTRENLSNLKNISSHLRRTLDEHAIVSATDEFGKIQYANSKFCDISGYSTDELIGNTHNIVKSGRHDKAFYDELWHTIKSSQTWQGEICNLKKNGDNYWVSSTIVPFTNRKTGKPEQFISVHTDITQLKETQSKLDQLYVEALAASDAKTKFIANMSHELRTPLNHIIGFTEIVQSMNNDPALEENLDIIRNAGDELLSKVENVLKLVKSQSLEQEQNAQVDLIDLLVSDIIPFAENSAREKKQKIVTRLPGKLPHLACDKIDLQNALRQLIKNACQFSFNGDTIGIEVTTRKSKVDIIVFDNGPGMPYEITSSQLDPFNIGENVLTKANSGMGLGLPLAKSLCQKNDGKFCIETEAGQGTKIIMTFYKAVV
ncbi:PAS domain-containing protein [Pseudemcibacter aquimaris]|uniref:sensor histidine kinase n=1 Tax=Pseudemcibacter aquimaris TaxID=2857064 RepID=UPI0020115EF4|nr:PAS domain-containing protein [Pseudemcibacter aquimaris]MCC3860404.1 PAS domain S-box protein [Pseudemcibacter aquimaris]WDU57730.1 PAS domain S-box protein [Pseudemcibacter aquimaris]